MELKRILARDTRSATEKAMALYGPDVLIISNHRVEGQTELIVALDVAEASAEELMEETLDAQVAATTADVLLNRKPEANKSSASAPFIDQLQQVLKPQALNESKPVNVAQAESTEQILTQGREQIRSQEIVSLVREELAALRQEFRLSQQTASWQMNQYWPAHIQPLVEAMTEAAVPTALRALLQEGLR